MEKVILKSSSSSVFANSQSIDSDRVLIAATTVKLKKVSMAYKLYDHPKDRLKEALHPLRKKYHRDFYALREIDLDVRKGEILGVVGKNGSGKSTLLKIVSNIMQSTSGSVQVNGTLSAILELGGGFNPDFTGIENVYFYGSIQGYSKKEMNERLGEIIEFADIGEFVYQPIKTYSSGMLARLAFAVSTVIDPEILILDEILAVGDDLFKRKCYARMEKFVEGQKTIFYVSHSIDSINQMCTRAILLDRGELILEGPPKLVTSYYQKLLFASRENAERVRREIVDLNEDEELKNAVKKAQEDKIKQKDKIKNVIKEDKEEKNKDENIKEKVKNILVQKPFYQQDLRPKSTIKYKNYDVDICDVRILDKDDRQVNHLVMNETYQYCLKIKSNIDIEDVAVGFEVKDIKGYRITSIESFLVYKSGYFIKRLKKGDELDIRYMFKCAFRPGIYFTNNGISSFKDGQQVVLNRIIDIYVFKVIDKKDYNGGIVNLIEKFEISNNKTGEKIEVYTKDGF